MFLHGFFAPLSRPPTPPPRASRLVPSLAVWCLERVRGKVKGVGVEEVHLALQNLLDSIEDDGIIFDGNGDGHIDSPLQRVLQALQKVYEDELVSNIQTSVGKQLNEHA